MMSRVPASPPGVETHASPSVDTAFVATPHVRHLPFFAPTPPSIITHTCAESPDCGQSVSVPQAQEVPHRAAGDLALVVHRETGTARQRGGARAVHAGEPARDARIAVIDAVIGRSREAAEETGVAARLVCSRASRGSRSSAPRRRRRLRVDPAPARPARPRHLPRYYRPPCILARAIDTRAPRVGPATAASAAAAAPAPRFGQRRVGNAVLRARVIAEVDVRDRRARGDRGDRGKHEGLELPSSLSVHAARLYSTLRGGKRCNFSRTPWSRTPCSRVWPRRSPRRSLAPPPLWARPVATAALLTPPPHRRSRPVAVPPRSYPPSLEYPPIHIRNGFETHRVTGLPRSAVQAAAREPESCETFDFMPSPRQSSSPPSLRAPPGSESPAVDPSAIAPQSANNDAGGEGSDAGTPVTNSPTPTGRRLARRERGRRGRGERRATTRARRP